MASFIRCSKLCHGAIFCITASSGSHPSKSTQSFCIQLPNDDSKLRKLTLRFIRLWFASQVEKLCSDLSFDTTKDLRSSSFRHHNDNNDATNKPQLTTVCISNHPPRREALLYNSTLNSRRKPWETCMSRSPASWLRCGLANL